MCVVLMLERRLQGPVGVGIKGVGFYVPEREVSNGELAQRLDTSDAWITDHLGIRCRRVAAPEQATSDLAIAAGRAALENAGVEAREVDLVIVTSITPDHCDPAPASLVQHGLGAVNAAAFSLNVGGCPDSIFALVTAAQFIAAQSCRTVLVIGAETLTRSLIDQDDRRTAVIFGDGAGAFVLRPTVPGTGLLGWTLTNDGSQYGAVLANAGGSRRPLDERALTEREQYVRMDGRQVLAFGRRVLPDSIRRVLALTGHGLDELALVVCHQASLNLIRCGMTALGLPMTKTFTNLDRYGNTGGASMPIALAEAVHGGRLRPGDLTALAAFGAGLAWGAAMMRWPAPREFL
jgi:3-oxoacyl-[acyl-carrier-protein] synthase-3